MKRRNRAMALILVMVMCMTLLAACGSQTGNEPNVDPQPPQTQSPAPQPSEPTQPPESQTPAPVEPVVVQDIVDYLWSVPEDAGVEEQIQLELRNASLIQAMEPIFEPESYSNYSKAATSLRSKKNEERLEKLMEAKAELMQDVSVEDGIIFIWNDFESMPIADGESYTMDQLDAASLLGYGYTTVLIKYMVEDPATAKGNIVMVSGGAMKGRANGSEGYPAVEVFNELGYNCFLLQRRVDPYSTIDIYMDCQRAIRAVRYYAEQEGWGGQDMIAACGYSGGGATILGAIRNCYGDITPAKYDFDYVPDEIDAVSSDLDAALIIYGAYNADGGDKIITEDNTKLPAFYISHGTADDTIPFENAQSLYDLAVAGGVPAVLSPIEGAPHGYGVGTTNDSFPDGCRAWPAEADAFMQSNLGHSRGPDFENYTIITSDNIADEPVEFKLLPDGYNTYETEHAMTSVIVRYTTDVYGEHYEKYARVYLPYGYDPNDKETKYNVLYFQHGNGGAPGVFEHDLKNLHAKNLLNNIFDPDHQVMEPVIIVCPTYYLVSDEDSYVTPRDNPAGDGRYEGIDQLYHLEIVQDLIPAVESQFNVHCTDFSEEGIKATRDHRAWAGYSRGAMCTYYIFHENFEYFAYWMPMSAPLTLAGSVAGSTSPEEAYNYLKSPIEANPDLDFFIFATAGGDGDKSGTMNLALDMQTQMKYFASQADVFSFGSDPEMNNLYFCRSEFLHNDLYFPYSLANAAGILFK